MLRLFAAWILALAAPQAGAQDAPDTPDAPDTAGARDLGAELARVVDLRTAPERRAAALALADDDDVTLDEWLEACRAFAPRGDGTIGPRTDETELVVEGTALTTPIAVHVPDGYRAGTPSPCLLILHWTGGTGPQAIGTWRALADELDLLLCAPSETGPNDGYAYSRREIAAALAALRWMRREFDVDEDRVFVTGISRGGHLTWDLALRHPDRFAGAVPVVGGPSFDPRGGRANLRYLENVLPLVLHDLQGALDQEGLVWNVRYAFERLEELGATRAHYHEFPDRGHSVDLVGVDWPAFFGETRRAPRPETVVRRFARAGEGRAFWVEVLEATDDVEEEFSPTIKKSRLDRMDEGEQRAWMAEEGEKRTARLEARFVAPGRIEVQSKYVESFRVLLEADMFEEGERFEVKVGGRRKRQVVRATKRVLLVEFAERFDRRFLPVAELSTHTTSR